MRPFHITLSEEHREVLEAYRRLGGLRSEADAVRALIEGVRHMVSGERDTPPLDVQLGRIEESVAGAAPKVNHKLSRPLKLAVKAKPASGRLRGFDPVTKEPIYD